LCISCGLCCDGTLFSSVQLFDGDDKTALLDAGASMRLDETDGLQKTYMKLGCPAHQEGRCQVYATRPKHCRQFKCKTLLAVENGQLPIEKARSRIAEAKSFKQITQEAAVRADPALATRSTREIVSFSADLLTDESKADQRARYAPLLIEAMAFNLIIQEHFYED